MIAALLGAAGALLYWVRGRGWPWGTTINRLIWGVPTGLLIGLLSPAPAYMLPVCMVASFLALIASGHSAHMGAYRQTPTPGDGNWTETPTHWWLPKLVDRTKHTALYNAIGLTAIGLLRLIIMVLPIVYWYPEALLTLAAAPIHAASYFAGWFLYERTNKRDPLEWCEAIWGAAQWVILAYILEL